ncbi:hypothetical protein [Allocoleopsis sp.]
MVLPLAGRDCITVHALFLAVVGVAIAEGAFLLSDEVEGAIAFRISPLF